MPKIRRNKIIGRFAMVACDNMVCLANFIAARRVRLQTGEHAGEVRATGQFEVLEFMDCH